jgi:hypothetical protein
MKRSPATQLVNKAIIEIQTLAGTLDQTDKEKLASDLRDLESKINTLRIFLQDHIIRKV